ncbi:MAG: tetratricopeptide repeat protein [Terracidiphilus sp.]
MLISAALFSASAQGGERSQLAQATAALQFGEADKALAILSPLAQPGGEAQAYNLKCRVEYSLEHWDQAAKDCEQAVTLDGQSSDDHLWLARTLGAQASRASFLSAFKLAKRVRAEMEEAVRLDPRSGEALADLGNYYYTAPGVAGGGIDKAEGVAAQMDRIDPIRARELRGHIAEQRKDNGTAEREYKQALTASAHPAFQWISLAGFYSRQKRWTEMEAAVHSGQIAAERDKRAAVALYSGASLLIQTKRDPVRAAKMLEEYLAGSAKSEDAPAFVAHTWLARLKQQLGDSVAAGRERAAALALAHEYKPALDLK